MAPSSAPLGAPPSWIIWGSSICQWRKGGESVLTQEHELSIEEAKGIMVLGWVGGLGSGGGYKSKRQRTHGRSQSCWSCVFPFCAPQLLESWSERFIFCKICCCAITLIRNEEGRGGRGRRACAMHNVHGRKLFFWREYFFGQCKE